MKRVYVSIFSIIFIVGAVGAKPLDSILTAVSFPKNADDLTFRQRMDVLTDGYEDFDTEFDSNGMCIKNCPYVGMTLKDFERRIERTAQEVQEDINEISSPSTTGYNIPDAQNGYNGSDSASDGQTGNEISETPSIPESPDNITQVAPATVQPASPIPVTPADQASVPPAESAPMPPVTQGGNSTVSSVTTETTIPTSCPLHVNPVRVSSEMGYRKKYKRNHNGMDLPVSVGTPVYAAADGVVVIRRNEGNGKGYGNYLVIQHAKNYYTVYGHLDKWMVSQGQNVRAGQEIAKSGNTGHSTGPHLHFEVLKNAPLVVQGATPVDPRLITQCPWNPAHR